MLSSFNLNYVTFDSICPDGLLVVNGLSIMWQKDSKSVKSSHVQL